MRRSILIAAFAAALALPGLASAQESPASPAASPSPAPSAPSPFPAPQVVAAPQRRTKTVVEYALVRGSGDGEQGLFSHADVMVVQFHKLELVRRGESLDGVRLVRRTCTYPLAKVKPDGKPSDVELPQGKGSEVVEEDLQ